MGLILYIDNIWKIILHNVIASFFIFGISIIQWWFAFFLKFIFPVINLFSLSLSILSISSTFWFKTNILCNFFLISFFSDLNCAVFSCVTSIFCIINVSSLLRLTLAKSVTSCKAVYFKFLFCSDLHCSSSFFFSVISGFFSFERIKHEKYNMHTTRLYNTLIQHVQRALIQHEFCTTRLYNTLIQHANRKIKSFQKKRKRQSYRMKISYDTKSMQHKKYNIRLVFGRRFRGIALLPALRCKNSPPKSEKRHSLSNIYIELIFYSELNDTL